MNSNNGFYKIFFLFFIGSCLDVFAGPTPPKPSGGGLPPPPPDGPIDGPIVFVILISLFFGLYLVYDKLKTKKIQV